jgi:histidine triad (HIT) family protein
MSTAREQTTLGASPCLFCQVLSGALPSSVVYRDEHCLAFMDLRQVDRRSAHVLIIPSRHVVSIRDLDEHTAGHLFTLSIQINQAVRAATSCAGVNFWISDGEVAGQEVPHAHLHVMARFANDGFGLRYPAPGPLYPSRQELDQAAQQIRTSLPGD